MSKYDSMRDAPAWQLLLDAARQLTEEGRTPFTRKDLVEQIHRIDPARNPQSLSPVIQGMTVNAPGGVPVACGEAFERIDRGLYVLIDPSAKSPAVRPTASARSQSTSRTVMKGQRSERVRLRLERLVADFDDFVHIYDEQVPFRRSGQYDLHRQTIDRRYQYRHVAEAVDDDEYVDLLHQTLNAWGIGRRRSRLLTPPELADRLRSEATRLSALDDLHLEELGSDAERVGAAVWDAIDALRVVDNISLFVSGTKTMHHLFPNLVPPMDRAYTGEFFGWAPQALQHDQRRTFLEAWSALVGVAEQTAPSRLVGKGWRTTPAKLIDNAIVAYMLTDETICPGCGSVGVFEIDDDAVIAAPPDLDNAVPAPMAPTHTCRSCGAHIAVRLDDE